MATVLTPNVTTVRAAAERGGTARSSRWFYAGIAGATLVASGVGFSHSYAARQAAHLPLSAAAVLHAALFSSWLVIYQIQTLLVATGHARLHRWLGGGAALLAAVMIVTAPPLAVDLARRRVLPGDVLFQMMLMLGDLVCFAAFVTAGVLLRRRGETHKRLMTLATVSLLPPGVSRWPIAVGNPAPVVSLVMILFVAALPIHDRLTRRRVHPVSLWGGLALLLSVPVRVMVARTTFWHQLGSWLIR